MSHFCAHAKHEPKSLIISNHFSEEEGEERTNRSELLASSPLNVQGRNLEQNLHWRSNNLHAGLLICAQGSQSLKVYLVKSIIVCFLTDRVLVISEWARVSLPAAGHEEDA